MVLDFQVKPRKPPRTPSTSPMKLNETAEKTSVSIDPIFLWAALLYSSHEPAITKNPAIGASIWTVAASMPGMLIAVKELYSNPYVMLKIPPKTDNAKAAVGFASTLTAKAFRRD